MPKLNQILATEKAIKTSSHEQLTSLYQTLQKEPLLNGISRTYQPLEEDGEKLPSESTLVQVRVQQALSSLADIMSPLYNLTLGRDLANTKALADVVVDGKVLLKGVPATFLLWLEKQLTDLHTLVSKLPTLSQAETWEYDPAQDSHKTPVVQTSRSKKVPHPLVKAEATDKHPAQVEIVHTDEVVGYWSTVKFSGAITRQKAQELRTRVEKLQVAAKYAREQANLVDVPPAEAAGPVFGFLFSNL
jgi:hypothetical protein